MSRLFRREFSLAGIDVEKTVEVVIDGVAVKVPDEVTILDACKSVNVTVPTLCHHSRLKNIGRCKGCAVEVQVASETATTFKVACSTPVQAGMKIFTKSPAALAEQDLATKVMKEKQQKVQVDVEDMTTEFDHLINYSNKSFTDYSSPAVVRDMSLCVDCGRCIRACSDIQGMNILSYCTTPGAPVYVEAQGGRPLFDTDCISCGQCAAFCPTGAINEKDDTARVFAELKAKKKVCVVQFAPATRVAIGEECGMPIGSIVTYKMVAALKKLGFDYVFDTNFSADLTILEEGTEFLTRLTGGGTLPLMTSCCPAWIETVEKHYPELIPNLSTAKSPQQMLGAIIKKFWAEKKGIKPEDIFSVSIMPCTAKKVECARGQLKQNSIPDVDVVLTTRELGKMLRKEGIARQFNALQEVKPDHPLGESTGAAVIFGATGGVMEAALRSVYELHTGNELPGINFKKARGLEHVKEAVVDVEGVMVKIAVVHGMNWAREFLEKLKTENRMKDYHFIEIMTCEGGCIGGGGQPRTGDPQAIGKRMKSIYAIDEASVLRKSHDNPDVKQLYTDFLVKPNSEVAHHLLHTHYSNRQQALEKVKVVYPPHIVEAPTAATGAPAHGSLSKLGPGEGVTIIYGTNTGNAANISSDIESALSEAKFHVRLIRANKYPATDITDEQQIVLVCSTVGDGEITADALGLFEHLNTLAAGALSGVRVAIFGLGSSGYQKFCNAGKLFGALFKKLGATMVVPVGLGDDLAPGGAEAALEPWYEELVEALPRELRTDYPKLPFRVTRKYIEEPAFEEIAPKGFTLATVKANNLMTPKDYPRSVYLMEVDTVGSNMPYKATDHILIMPQNVDADVNDLLTNVLHVNPDDVINIVPQTSKAKRVPFPRTLSNRQLFTYYLDVFGRPNRKFIQLLSEYAKQPNEKATLADLSSVDAFASLYESGKTVADVLKEFPSARPPLAALLCVLNLLHARHYSISSAPEKVPNAQLIVVINRFETPTGWRDGLCTKYLKDVAAGQKIACRIEPGQIKMPENPEAPLLMVGLGMGVAAFRSILQYRQAMSKKGAKFGPATLYYSARNKDKDYFFDKEWKQMEKEGVAKIVPICSHDQKDLYFVQNHMNDHPEEVWRILGEPKNAAEEACYFYCGPAAGVPEYLHKAMTNSLIKLGDMNESKADARLQYMKEDKRYVLEAFGGVDLSKKTKPASVAAVRKIQQNSPAPLTPVAARRNPVGNSGPAAVANEDKTIDMQSRISKAMIAEVKKSTLWTAVSKDNHLSSELLKAISSGSMNSALELQ